MPAVPHSLSQGPGYGTDISNHRRVEKPVSVRGTVEIYGSLVQIQDPGRSKRASTFQRNGNCVGWEKHIRAREQTSDVKAVSE